MPSISPTNELGCSYLKLTYSQWLAIEEPLFFNFVDPYEGNHWLFQQGATCLSAYANLVKLLRVEGKLYKLEGKQRKAVWSSGKLQPPELLNALVFDITEVEFKELNAQALNQHMAILPPQDAVKVVYAELGLVLNSERLKGGFINEAVNIALRGKQRPLQDKRSAREREDINMHKAIKLLTPELTVIDGIAPNPDIFVTGVLAGTLILLGINKNYRDFLVRLSDQRGEIKGDLADPVTLLLRAINKYKLSQRVMQKRMTIDLCKITIQAALLWEEGDQSPKYWRKRDLAGVDHMPYVRELRGIKQITAQWDL